MKKYIYVRRIRHLFGEGMGRLIILLVLLVILAGLVISNTTGTNASIDDTPNNEVTNIQAESDNSASAIITISMYILPDE